MNAIDTGGAFHPYQPMTDISSGASLRDVIAIHAMQGIISMISGGGIVIRRDNVADEPLSVPKHGALIAAYSYQMADAMLQARKEKAP